MAGKKIRSRTHTSISVSSLSHRPNNTAAVASAGPRSKSTDELLCMTKEQLKVECRKRGQKTTGNKTELLQRLGHRMSNPRRKDNPSTSNGNVLEAHQNNHMTQKDQPSTSRGTSSDQQRKQREKDERETLLLWRRPFITLEYALREFFCLLHTYGAKLLEHKGMVFVVVISVLSSYLLINTNGPHQEIVQKFYKKFLWCSYWVGLGILSSVGLGTGLHTFILYLGPHIARVTLAAYECESLNFPEPPYPDDIICPSDGSKTVITILAIMSKVRLEAMCWGAGTALGELPPYFMARAARLSGIDPDDEDSELKELEELERKKSNYSELTWLEKGKILIEEIVQKVGFFGILACASIPNPLFDLAGITCGHFLVPFWTFFGATLIGKAVIKMHIQKLFVIIAFNETLIETALMWLRLVPVVGSKLQKPFKAFLDGQKAKLHKKSDPADVPEASNIIAKLFECFVFAMILYFVVSIINSFAQSYHKRLHKKKT